MSFTTIASNVDEYIPLYDIVIIDNQLESVSVSSDEVKRLLIAHPNVFYMCGSIIGRDHLLYDKVITFDLFWEIIKHQYTSFQLGTSHFVGNSNTRSGVVYIGGEMRSYRRYIYDLLETVNIKKIQRDNVVSCTDDVYYDDYTQQFVDKCNEKYNVTGVIPDSSPLYQPTYLGIDGRRQGECSLGVFILPEYTMSNCIVYPESSFTNNEFHPTEKTWKCVVCNTHWIMFAGRGAYGIMRDYGFRSILEETPVGIGFDNISNHEQRYNAVVEAIRYVSENPAVFDTANAKNILTDNYRNFYNNNRIIKQMVTRIDTLLREAQ